MRSIGEASGYDRFTDPERALEQWKGWAVYRAHNFLSPIFTRKRKKKRLYRMLEHMHGVLNEVYL